MIGWQFHDIFKENGEKGTGTDVTVADNENAADNGITVLNKVSDNGITVEQRKIMENKKFILRDPERTLVLSKEDEATVFYTTSTDSAICEVEVKGHIENIYAQNKKDTFSEGSIEHMIAQEAQTEENIFLDDIKRAEEYKLQEDYEMWINNVPNSDTCENYTKKEKCFVKLRERI